MKFLYLIPARAGSKGIPGKNYKPLAGKPLILYTIELVRQVADDNDICISTDDPEIISIANKINLKVPFIRPAELAADNTSMREVIMHAINYYKNIDIIYDAIILLQPTSPFRKISDLKNIITIYCNDLDMVVSVGKSKANPYYTLFEENDEGYLVKSKKGNFKYRQECPITYQLNGSIYVINVQSIINNEMSEFKKIRKYLMDPLYSIDIDEKLDWEFAEFLLQKGYITFT